MTFFLTDARRNTDLQNSRYIYIGSGSHRQSTGSCTPVFGGEDEWLWRGRLKAVSDTARL